MLQLVKNQDDVRKIRNILKRPRDEKSDFGYNYHNEYYEHNERFNLEERLAKKRLYNAVESYNEAWEVVEYTIRPIIMKASVKYYEHRKNGEEIALQTFNYTLKETGIPYTVKPMDIDDLVSD